MVEIDNVECPMLKKKIELGYCIELQWISDDAISATDDEADLNVDDFEICRSCKKRVDLNC